MEGGSQEPASGAGKRALSILIATVLGACLSMSTAAASTADEQQEGGRTGGVSVEGPFSVPFVTLRNRTGSSSPAEYFGGERGEPTAGVCTVAFSPIRALEGIAEAAPFYLPDEKIELAAIRETPLEDLFSGVESFLHGDGGAVVVYIHGYKIDFETSCRRGAIFQRALGPQNRIVLFSWPADSNALKYTWDEADLMWSVPYLARFVDEIVKRAGKGRVDVVAHSLGARGAALALARMAYREPAASILNELVLVAPDIDTDIFRQELPLFRKAARRITVYASEKDKALKVSHEVHGYPRLGMAGEYLAVLEGVETIDVSPIETRRFSGHIYHLFNPEVTGDLTRLLRTGEPAGERPGLQALESDGLPFWRLVE